MTSAGASAGTLETPAAGRRSYQWLDVLLPPATALAVLGVALLLLLTPIWVHAALDLAGGGVPGGDRIAAHAISDRTVSDLLSGGGFAILLPNGEPMYTADEASHLRDVRVVLYGFLLLAGVALALLVGAFMRGSRDARTWRALARGGALLVVAVIVLGLVGALAFGVAFELFHRLLFPGGNWAFPIDSNLIRLYPFAFWQLSAAAMGVLAAVGGAAAWWMGRRRAARLGQR